MALKVIDGFDHYGTQADMQARGQGNPLQWNDIPGAQITFVAGRGGYGKAASVAGNLDGSTGVGCSFNANYASGIPAIASLVYPGGPGHVDYLLMDYTNNVVQLCCRCFMDSGTVQAYAGDPDLGVGTTTAVFLGASPPNAFSPFIWNKVELYGSMGASGSFNIHFNGNSALGLTNVQTICPAAQLPSGGTANNWFNGFKVRLGQLGSAGVVGALLDDFNLTDSTTGPGSYPCNNFLGDCAARTLFTTANVSVTWTPLANTNWQEVGETAFDGDASYNFATTAGQTDSFTFTALPTTVSAVFGVQVTGAYRKLDASNQSITQGITASGSSASGASWNMSLNYSWMTDLFVLNPNTGASWLPSAVNALVASYTLNS